MIARYLLDTHVFVRWLREPERLSREQWRTVREANRRGEPVAISAMTLVEVATVVASRRRQERIDVLLSDVGSAAFDVLPITLEVAGEVHALGEYLRDPADRVIVTTARVHGLQLLTSDQRIIDSKLVRVID